MPPRYLMAIDIDGTLLRSDGTIAASDRKAIARARAAGIAVTLATGRLAPSTIPLARDLGIDGPLICADGGATVSPDTEAALRLCTVPQPAVVSTLPCLRDHRLAPFVFTHEAVHGAFEDVRRSPFLSGWTDSIQGQHDFDELLRSAGAPPAIILLGVGDEEDVRAAHQQLRDRTMPDLEMNLFPVGMTKRWALRIVGQGCTKGIALEHLAADLEIDVDSVAAIGDWYNDIPMFDWAGMSFAMGHAPEEVQDSATHCLKATAKTGGGVAEMLEHLLGPAATGSR